MTKGPEGRVRVTGPPRRPGRTRRPGRGDIDEGTRVGAILVSSLVEVQRQLAVRILAVLALCVGSLPLVFAASPTLAELRFLGIPSAYLLLWVLVHPLLITLGWIFVRRAEANERAFTTLVEHEETDVGDRSRP